MSHAFRFALNATVFWVVASTFWYSCLLKQVCLPDPPADGAGFSLFPSEVTPRPSQPAATGTTTPATPATPAGAPARFEGSLGFAWNSAEPVRGLKFETYRAEVVRGDGPDRTLEIIGTYYPGDSSFGFIELPDGKIMMRSYGSMTYALLKSYVLCGLKPDDNRVKAALNWVSKNFTVTENPGAAPNAPEETKLQGLFYYYLAMAQTLDNMGIKEHTIFLELDMNKIQQVRGMDLAFVTTAANDQECRELLAQFFQSTFDDIFALDPHAVVFIDSTRAAKLASWLSDNGTRDGIRQVAQGVQAGQRWPTLRLIRIREQAPSLGQEKLHQAGDGATPISTWTTTPRLFRVGGAAAPTFWSLARPSTHHKRGASCYRPMPLPNSNQSADSPEPFTIFPPQPDKQHLNSRAVEIVVLQKQDGDDDVQLASFTQHLRAGLMTARNERWVTTPTPLRIIDKLGEYMRG